MDQTTTPAIDGNGLTRASLQQRIYEQLRAALIGGDYGPGVCTENLNPHIMVMKPAKDSM
jgi:hypothetical protein